MKEIDIKEIWKSAGTQHKNYSLDEIKAYRSKKSMQITRSGKLTIYFDILFKCIVLLELLYLLFTIKDQMPYQLLVILSLATIAFLNSLNFKYLKRLKLIKETDAIVQNLKNKLLYLKTAHSSFIFTSSLSNPFFVLSSFLIYYFIKYGRIQIGSAIDHLIMLLFVIASFFIAYYAQRHVFKLQLKELQDSLLEIDNLELESIKIIEARAQKRKQMIMFSILILVGILIFLIMLWK